MILLLAFEYLIDGDKHLTGNSSDRLLMAASSGDA